MSMEYADEHIPFLKRNIKSHSSNKRNICSSANIFGTILLSIWFVYFISTCNIKSHSNGKCDVTQGKWERALVKPFPHIPLFTKRCYKVDFTCTQDFWGAEDHKFPDIQPHLCWCLPAGTSKLDQYRWKPNCANPPKFAPKRFCESLKLSPLIFKGDSIAHQAHAALGNTLFQKKMQFKTDSPEVKYKRNLIKTS